MEGPLRVRPADAGDADLLLAWANDPATRAVSLHTAPIGRDEHVRWLAGVLADARSGVWIGLHGDRPVGQVRVQLDDHGNGEVSISVAAEERGRGLAGPLLDAGLAAAAAALPVTTFVAHVRPDNEPSRRLFAGAGFDDAGRVVRAGVEVLEFRRAATVRPVGAGGGRVLRFVSRADDRSAGGRVVVLDPAWTAPRTGVGGPADPFAARDLVSAVLRERDLFEETTTALDAWADAARIADRMTVDGVSFWFQRRIGLWWWLHGRLLWIAVLERLVSDERPDALELPADADRALRDAAGLVAGRDAIPITSRAGTGAVEPPADGPSGPSAVEDDLAGPTAGDGLTRLPLLGPFVARINARRARRTLAVRRQAIDSRLDRLLAEPGRLLVLVDPASNQRIDLPDGPIVGSPFLEPVLRVLAGTRLDPVRLEIGSTLGDPETWARLSDPTGARTLPFDILARRFAAPDDAEAGRRTAEAIGRDLRTIPAPLPVNGLDLAPLLVAELIRATERSWLPGRLRDLRRARRFIAALRPAGLFLVNEYGRSEWVAAARSEGVPVAAVQHGIIHARHPGYVHRRRHPALPVPDRFYAFGRFEERLLTTGSVFRPDEVHVAGSPRLDLAASGPAAGTAGGATGAAGGATAAIRSALGVAPGDRLLVVSTTFGPPRQLYTPGALAALLDDDLDGVHLVVKTHPNEPTDDLYERLVGGLRRSLGRPPARLTVVQAIDLYALLAAADAHLGVFSTVLTEAVAVGTPNLLAVTQATSDLLGYIDAGVAVGVRSGAELRAALDRIAAGHGTDPAARAAFLADHFEPGSASARIGADLLAWLAPAG